MLNVHQKHLANFHLHPKLHVKDNGRIIMIAPIWVPHVVTHKMWLGKEYLLVAGINFGPNILTLKNHDDLYLLYYILILFGGGGL